MDARAWLAMHYAPAGPQPPAETRVGVVVIALRSAQNGATTALTVAYAFFGQEHTHGDAYRFYGLLALVMGWVFLGLALAFWRVAIRLYQSTDS